MAYILNTKKDIDAMLKSIGANSMEELFSHLPESLRLKKPLNLPQGLSEQEVKGVVEAIAAKNLPIYKFNSFLGAGCYDHYIPAALNALISRSEFVTAYTPYQPEISQGILQAIYEYQSYICLLTGLDVSNASLFDGASGLAEAVLMSLRITGKNKILVARSIHPQYRQTLDTYLKGFNISVKEIDFNNEGFLDLASLNKNIKDDVACLVLASPNFFGMVEDVARVAEFVKKFGALLVLSANPMSLAILKSPASCGVDICCGDGQPLGTALNFGGPSFGYIAAKNEYLRQLPGRIVGRTTDKDRKTAYCLTMQAREQHIRREKATSNICSNQSLNAIGAAIYLSLMGEEGFREAALNSLNLAHYLYEQIKTITGVKIRFSNRFFNEFVWEFNAAEKIVKKLLKKNIIAGLPISQFYRGMKNCVLSCCTEKKSKSDIDIFIEEFKKLI